MVPDEQEDEVERFREFLDHVSPEDFESGQLSPSGDPQPQVEGYDTPAGAVVVDHPRPEAYLRGVSSL